MMLPNCGISQNSPTNSLYKGAQLSGYNQATGKPSAAWSLSASVPLADSPEMSKSFALQRNLGPSDSVLSLGGGRAPEQRFPIEVQ